MSESVLRALKDRFNGRTNAQESAHELAIHSLDVVRRCVQDEFNVEVNRIVQRYLDVSSVDDALSLLASRPSYPHCHIVILFQTYFRTAVKNIKDNLGDEVLTMAASVSLCCIMHIHYIYIT